MMIKLINFSIGLPKKMDYANGKEIESAICKDTVEEAFLTKQGFQGDGVADIRFHGGPDRAVCVYSQEHYSLWNKEFETTLPHSAFGENLTVTNMNEHQVHIGDTFRLGDALIQITQGRIPCSTITKRTQIPLLLARIIETGYTGYLCRVLEEGTVRRDSKITLINPHPSRVSVSYANQIYFHNRTDSEGINKVLSVQELASDWRDRLEKRLNQLTK
ncbi:MOSC domain-containing protein [Sporosarcina sp. CAU 1771]